MSNKGVIIHPPRQYVYATLQYIQNKATYSKNFLQHPEFKNIFLKTFLDFCNDQNCHNELFSWKYAHSNSDFDINVMLFFGTYIDANVVHCYVN